MQKKRTAFVTGASQGIGAAIALGLARDGYDVAVSSTRPEKLPEVRRQLEAAGARVATMPWDAPVTNAVRLFSDMREL